MKNFIQRHSASALRTSMLALLLSGCVVEGGGGGGYAYDGSVDVGVDYYQPVGVVVGGFGHPDYHVGPSRGDDHRGDPGHAAPPSRGNPSAPHAFRPAAPSHAAPSIPSRNRGK